MKRLPTLGPWTAEQSCDEDGHPYYSDDLGAVWCVASPHTADTATWVVDALSEPDARLIAAAPDLLEALTNALAAGLPDVVADAARVAIARATGAA